MTTSPSQQMISLLKKSKNVLLLTHARADGDGLSACLALARTLDVMGIKSTIANADPVGFVYRFLPGVDRVVNSIAGAHDLLLSIPLHGREVAELRHTIEDGILKITIQSTSMAFTADDVSCGVGTADYDLIVTCDTPELPMLGRLFEINPGLFYEVPVINIDHHASNTGFGRVNIIDVTAASTTEILFRIIRELEVDSGQTIVSADIATLLLTGLITDTGSFQHSNTTPRSLEVAAELIECGARQQEIINHIFKTKQLATLKLWGRVLSKIEYDEEHRFVWSALTKNDLAECGGTDADVGDVIDEVMTNAPGAEVVLLLKQNGIGVTGSLRTTSPSVSAMEIAGLFGGGGHLQASGFKIVGKTVEEVVSEVIQRVRAYQAQRLNIVPTSRAEPVASHDSRLTTERMTRLAERIAFVTEQTQAKGDIAPATT